MKKITSIAAIVLFCGLAMTSCKKDYTCTCKNSDGEVTATYKFNGTKKSAAKSGCDTWNNAAKVSGGSCGL